MARSADDIPPDDIPPAGAIRRGVVLTGLILGLALTSAACDGDDTGTTADADPGSPEPAADPAEPADDDTTSDGAPGNGDANDREAAVPALLSLELVDVDGQPFTLADYTGTPVLVESFATWCPSCRAQLERNQGAAVSLGDTAAFVAVSTETELDPAAVAAYAEENGFGDIRFAVLSDEQLALLTEAYGNSAINPPATPHWFISADGMVGDLITGATGTDEIPALLGI